MVEPSEEKKEMIVNGREMNKGRRRRAQRQFSRGLAAGLEGRSPKAA